jgi:protein-L-isoaspartate(D-aspartate) O-methyltransferase
MVRTIQHLYDLTDPNILTALANVPRHWFVPASQQLYAYLDSPLPIGNRQTISQPYIVAYMTHLLRLTPQMKVLEIGTGSGYQAAILNEFTPQVYTVEIIEPLARQAFERFNEHGYKAITAKIGDGYKGWPEFAPFDAVIVTCAPDQIPQPLIDQLKPDGKMVIPVGDTRSIQHLVLVTKNPDASVTRKNLMPVRFVPMLRDKQPQ